LNRFAGLATSFVALEVREKIIIITCVVLVLAALTEMLIVENVVKTIEENESAKIAALAESEELTARLTKLQLEIAKDIDAPAKRRVAELTAEYERLDGLVTGRVPDLVTPTEMGDVLRELVSKSDGIEFISLNNVPVKKITSNQNVEVDSEGNVQAVGGPDGEIAVYAHGLMLELGGNFVSIMEFIKQVESMEWNFFWESISLKTEEYPYSKVKLQISTFSNDEEILKL